MGSYQSGTGVNLEVDLIGRYVERLLLGDKAADSSSKSTITEDFLVQAGFPAK